MDDFDEIIKQIKIYRSPEAYLDDIFMKVKKYRNENFKNYEYYFFKLNDIIVFEYQVEINYFFYDIKIHRYLLQKYKCPDKQIEDLIKEKVKIYFGYKDINCDFGHV